MYVLRMLASAAVAICESVVSERVLDVRRSIEWVSCKVSGLLRTNYDVKAIVEIKGVCLVRKAWLAF